jgi:protein O-GlcNAc transferase
MQDLNIPPEIAMGMGLQAKARGNPEQALTCFERALQQGLESAELLYLIGDTLHDLSRLDQAIERLQRARKLDSQHVGAVYTLAVALQDKGMLEEAIACYRVAEALRPDHAKTYNNMGSAYLRIGQSDEAIACFKKASHLDPDFFMAHYNLGSVHYQNRNIADAKQSFQRALLLKPDFAQAHNNFANLLKEEGQLKLAAVEYRLAIHYNQNLTEAYFNLANVLIKIWHTEEALALLERLLTIDPQNEIGHSNYLFYAHYSDRFNADDFYRMARNWEQMHAAVFEERAKKIKFTNLVDTERRLKIGYVSADFCLHPVGLFIESVLASHDKSDVEVYCYYNFIQRDKLTTRIATLVDHWRDIHGVSDELVEALIRQDEIDILVDLSGHTEANRLLLFARKSAPVQVTWLGYFATTGISAIDYLIADQVGVPESHRKHFAETVWYLPDTRLCFSVPEINLPVSPLPALKNDYITFGCFQNMSKVGDKVLATWAAILTDLPDARFRWQCHQLKDPEVVQELMLRLQQNGIDPARMTLLGSVAHEAYLSAHSEVDMILDTFPYPGGTTTCEALWMGVPTLTLAGDTLLSRQGASLLTAVGLSDWIVTSRKDYIDKALTLAGDIPKLAKLRAVLREQVKTSPLLDAPRFAHGLEEAYRSMWRKWCTSQST